MIDTKYKNHDDVECFDYLAVLLWAWIPQEELHITTFDNENWYAKNDYLSSQARAHVFHFFPFKFLPAKRTLSLLSFISS